MKFKSKIVLFVCAFALIFSIVSVSCFAYVPSIEVGSTYSFVPFILTDSLSGDPFDFDVSGDFTIEIDGDICNNFTVYNNSVYIVGQNFDYLYSYGSGGWKWVRSDFHGNSTVLDSLEFTVVEMSLDLYYPFIDWLCGNVILVSESFYDNLYSSISDGVFGAGASLSPEQVMTLTLISTVLSYAFILLPLLLVIGFVLRCFRL